jgi:hypothetical protein
VDDKNLRKSSKTKGICQLFVSFAPAEGAPREMSYQIGWDET